MRPFPPAGERRVTVIQGEQHVSDDPLVVLTTLLGSCVAACLRDPLAGIGGMNHFLLPGREAGNGAALRHGVHAMELLVNDLLRRGAARERLQAKLFGGGRMVKGLGDIGAQNAGFAERFLHEEGIAWVGGSLGGGRGRRVQFWPVSGRARQMMLAPQDAEVVRAERRPAAFPASGSVELF